MLSSLDRLVFWSYYSYCKYKKTSWTGASQPVRWDLEHFLMRRVSQAAAYEGIIYQINKRDPCQEPEGNFFTKVSRRNFLSQLSWKRNPQREPDRKTTNNNDRHFTIKRCQRKEKHNLHNFPADRSQNSKWPFNQNNFPGNTKLVSVDSWIICCIIFASLTLLSSFFFTKNWIPHEKRSTDNERLLVNWGRFQLILSLVLTPM